MSNTRLLGQFSRWDEYHEGGSVRSSGDDTVRNRAPRRPDVRRAFSSRRRTDYTSSSEYRKHQSKRRFIFHRGFFRRQDHSTPTQAMIHHQTSTQKKKKKRQHQKFANQRELMACMNYIDLESLQRQSYNDSLVISSPHVTFFKPSQDDNYNHMDYNSSNVIVNRLVPTKLYLNSRNTHLQPATPTSFSSLMTGTPTPIPQGLTAAMTPPHNVITRKISIRNRNKSRHRDTNSNNSRTNTTVRRCNTLPVSLQRRSSSQQLLELWRQYLRKVIVQRIQLRMQLLTSEPQTSTSSTSYSSALSSVSLASASCHNGQLEPHQPRQEQIKLY